MFNKWTKRADTPEVAETLDKDLGLGLRNKVKSQKALGESPLLIQGLHREWAGVTQRIRGDSCDQQVRKFSGLNCEKLESPIVKICEVGTVGSYYYLGVRYFIQLNCEALRAGL